MMTTVDIILFVAGRHGAAACAYFRFLKWLFFMNLFVTIFVIGVFVVPYEILKPDMFSQTLPTSFSKFRLYPSVVLSSHSTHEFY